MTNHRKLIRMASLVAVTTLGPAVFLAGCGDDTTTPSAGGAPAPAFAPGDAIDVPAGPKPTVVLVHGAFADASGWSAVANRLGDLGFSVFAPANPLRGLAADSAYLRAFLDTIEGPIILVGHSYGGMVMTNAALEDDDVMALVYAAAFAPGEGDTVGGLLAQFPGSQLGEDALTIRPYPLPDGTQGAEGYVVVEAFGDVFAGDLPEDEAEVLARTQRPGSTATLTEPSGPPAWDSIPSLYLVATQDQLIPAAAARFMAERAGARTVEVEASHLVIASQPEAVVELIIEAFRSIP